MEIARSFGGRRAAAAAWDRVAVGARGGRARLLPGARCAPRPDATGPFGDRSSCAATSRSRRSPRASRTRRLPTAVGYRVVYAPRVRLLQVVDGGIVVGDPAALEPLLARAARRARRGEVDAVARAAAAGRLDARRARSRRSAAPLAAPALHRRRGRGAASSCPASFEEFVASRSSNTRWRIRRDAKRLAAALGDELAVEVVREPASSTGSSATPTRVARATYQRALGAGFADTPEQRELARLGLEHGWVRGYLLYLGDEPIAYWLCSTYRGTMLIRHDRLRRRLRRAPRRALPADARDRGRDAPTRRSRVLDFGPGDAAYKQQFSSESWLERERSSSSRRRFRGLRDQRDRARAILGSARLARRALDADGLTDRVKSRWRSRVRIGSAP